MAVDLIDVEEYNKLKVTPTRGGRSRFRDQGYSRKTTGAIAEMQGNQNKHNTLVGGMISHGMDANAAMVEAEKWGDYAKAKKSKSGAKASQDYGDKAMASAEKLKENMRGVQGYTEKYSVTRSPTEQEAVAAGAKKNDGIKRQASEQYNTQSFDDLPSDDVFTDPSGKRYTKEGEALNFGRNVIEAGDEYYTEDTDPNGATKVSPFLVTDQKEEKRVGTAQSISDNAKAVAANTQRDKRRAEPVGGGMISSGLKKGGVLDSNIQSAYAELEQYLHK